MAEDKPQSTSSVNTGPLIKGMVKDMDDSYSPQGSWYHARNAMPNSRDGNLGTLANEPSNLLCFTFKYTLIGAIHMYKDIWAVFSTDDVNSEIGTFDEGQCVYTPLKNCNGTNMNPANCLGFKTTNLIKGVSKENSDCTWQVYFADSLNPDRTVNIDKPAFVEICTDENNVILPGPTGYVSVGCITCVCTDLIDCDKIRLASLVTVPCLNVTRGPNSGNLQNGSYYAVAAYVLNDQRVTDYYTPSNVQSIFEHDNLSGSLQIDIIQMDQVHFDYFELIIVRTINSQTSAKRIGVYSTRQSAISLDYINEALPSIPIEDIPLRKPNYDRSDGIFQVGQFMLRTGPRALFDFNYQPLANRITTKWQAVAYPSNYYAKSGNVTGYMRDEVYPFFIRWVYSTGDRSSSYHIPGRPAFRGLAASASSPYEKDLTGTFFNAAGPNNIEISDPIAPYTPKYWEVTNTGITTAGSLNNAFPLNVQSDGGLLIAEGLMGYWESTESYPDKKPDAFNASAHPWSAIPLPPYTSYGVTTIDDYDLCGEKIRHHKFPDNETIAHFRNKPGSLVSINTTTFIPDPSEQEIVVLGVAFDNILPPVDNNGVLIPGIVGYEILRGSREGNKTVVAKGIINNMRTYKLENSNQTGLYQNYPYNFLGSDPTLADPENLGESVFPPIPPDNGPKAGVSRNQFTFHSPETSFNNPFLSSKELKLYGELFGNVFGNFDESPKHPKEKLITDFAFVTAALIGTALAAMTVRGERIDNIASPYVNKNGSGIFPIASGVGTGLWGINDPASIALLLAAQGTAAAAYGGAQTAADNGNLLVNVIASLFPFPGGDVSDATVSSILNALALNPAVINPARGRQIKKSQHDYLDPAIQTLESFMLFSNYWTMGTESSLNLIMSVMPFTQYAYRYTSHGFINNYGIGVDSKTSGNQIRYRINNSIYLNEGFQQFGQNGNAKINNLYRSKTVALQVDVPPLGGVQDPGIVGSFGGDNTVQSISTSIPIRPLKDPSKKDRNPVNIKGEFATRTGSHYAAMKLRVRNQYGQLNGIIQVPVSTCPASSTLPLVAGTTVVPTGSLFNGDIYIGRHTEKNTFFYFWDWLYGQPEGYEFDYRLRYMLNFPRYWANFEKYDPSEFLSGIANWVTSLFSSPLNLPSNRHVLDGGSIISVTTPGSFFASLLRVTERYFYTFQSGVRDFYVESEINVSLRDWEEPIEKRHYDPDRFTDLPTLFDVPVLKAGNFYRYDQSLSVSRIFNNFFSWGNIQERDYDPLVAASCYTYYPNRMIYSLPQEREGRKDFWRVFLINNYKDFKSRISAVRPINKTGAIIMFDTESPAMFTGVDTLQSDAGVEITVGDGGLFNREPQAIVNTDASYEYASCQNRLSVVNTKYGLFWISQNQGKIFNYTNGLNEISLNSLWFWLATYLPYKLTQDFPNFDLLDNPVVGIGCQTIYDNQEDTIYFCKKDYKLKPQYIGQVVYNPLNSILPTLPGFFLGALPIRLGDPLYFDDASWTLSYDPKDKFWVSFHDWHPDLTLPGKNEFLSTVHDPITNQGSIWRHNARTDSFCNFYGIDYPFEIDRIAQTGVGVNTIRSIEYYLEAYIYNQTTEDIYEVLDANFDHATIYNREQVSGTLILNQMPKNSVAKRLLYPIINPTSIDILADKVEQKYRFNQFWDITADRGEFTFPNVQRPIWITSINGYIRDLNPANLNYQKNSFERKKFRHYANHLRLYKNISGNINYICKLINAKELVSMR